MTAKQLTKKINKGYEQAVSEATLAAPPLLAAVKREAAFYRQQLELICKDTRRTRARRLAESALTFWDALKSEAAKRKP